MKNTRLLTSMLAAFGLLLTACTVQSSEPDVQDQIVDQRDVPLPAVHHTRYDVLLETNVLPNKAGLHATAMHVWRSGETSSNKMVVQIYLPEMNLEDGAYATATVTKCGGRDVRVNPGALAKTPWEASASFEPSGTEL